MPTAQDIGVRFVHMGPYDLALPAATIQETPFRAETAERMADSFTVVDRPYLFDGAPDVVQKFSWSLAWPNVNAADGLAEIFEDIESMPGFFDFSLWKRCVERFSGDGTRLTFRMLRRLANVSLSASTPPGITWAPVVKVGGTTIASGVTFGEADEKGTVLATFSGTTPATAPAAASSNVRISYTPLFLVRVVSPQRSYSTPFQEGRSLTLEEI